MAKPRGIIVFGASGCGTTTIAEKLSKFLNFSHFDVDDYYWKKSEIPFTISIPPKERVIKLHKAIENSEGFVLSGSICGWGDELISFLNLAVFVTTPAELRLKRIKKREIARFGSRVLEGGDMYKNHQDFLEWAKSYDTSDENSRSLALHEKWLKILTCPTLRVSGKNSSLATKIILKEIMKMN